MAGGNDASLKLAAIGFALTLPRPMIWWTQTPIEPARFSSCSQPLVWPAGCGIDTI